MQFRFMVDAMIETMIETMLKELIWFLIEEGRMPGQNDFVRVFFLSGFCRNWILT